MENGNSALFEIEISLPEKRLTQLSERLIGFENRYLRIHQDLRMLVDTEGLEKWSQNFYKRQVAIIESLSDRYPLIIFHGDVGTGKTATAEAVANKLATELKKEARFFKLSTRVRGQGSVGEMSSLINEAFDVVGKEAGKSRISFLLIDEADFLASNRSQAQSHHEDKVAVNTLIQKIDDIRRFRGRFVVFLCTNHLRLIDPAILRRAAYVEEFKRPDARERQQLLELDCSDLEFTGDDISKLVEAMGPGGQHGVGYTFSDIRTRLLPEALGRAFPSRRIELQDLLDAVASISPTREVS